MTTERFYLRRKWSNRIMLGLCGAGAGLGILVLALILGYTLVHGIAALNLDFLTQAAKPTGEVGGGMRNEIIGTLILVALGTAIALPVGLMAGIFLTEFASPRIGDCGPIYGGYSGRRSLDRGRRLCVCYRRAAHAHLSPLSPPAWRWPSS